MHKAQAAAEQLWCGCADALHEPLPLFVHAVINQIDGGHSFDPTLVYVRLLGSCVD
jgi:hypothetical protein